MSSTSLFFPLLNILTSSPELPVIWIFTLFSWVSFLRNPLFALGIVVPITEVLVVVLCNVLIVFIGQYIVTFFFFKILFTFFICV